MRHLRNHVPVVLLALRGIAEDAGLRWETLADTLKKAGRLHLETY